MDEITEERIKLEMQKMIGGALTKLEWFLLFTFVDQAIAKDEMFSSDQDRVALANTVKRLHDQIFPAPKTETLEDKLKVAPKKLIVPQGTDIIV